MFPILAHFIWYSLEIVLRFENISYLFLKPVEQKYPILQN